MTLGSKRSIAAVTLMGFFLAIQTTAAPPTPYSTKEACEKATGTPCVLSACQDQCMADAQPEWVPAGVAKPPHALIGPNSFGLSAPEGWKYHKLLSEDSEAGEFVGSGMRLVFDYGIFSTEFAVEGNPHYSISYETIDGHRTKVVVAKDSTARFTGVYFNDLPDIYGLSATHKVKLSVYGEYLTPDQQEIALQIMRTIYFKKLILK